MDSSRPGILSVSKKKRKKAHVSWTEEAERKQEKSEKFTVQVISSPKGYKQRFENEMIRPSSCGLWMMKPELDPQMGWMGYF
jgi:hypothetical protein